MKKMKNMKKMTIVLYYPETVTAADIKDYASDALRCWGGQKHPYDPLFYTTKAPKREMKIVKDDGEGLLRG